MDDRGDELTPDEKLSLAAMEWSACLAPAMEKVMAAIQEFLDAMQDVIEHISEVFRATSQTPAPWNRRKQDKRGLRVGRGVNVSLPPPLYVSWCPIGRRG